MFQKMIADFKAASFTDQVLVIGVVLVAFFMIIMMLQLCNIASIGRRINKKMKKIVSLEKKAKKRGRKVIKASSDEQSPVIPIGSPEGYIKAVKKEQPIIVNVNVPNASNPTEIAEAVASAVDLPAWTGYDDDEDEVVDVAPVVVAPAATEVVEEPVEEVVEEPVVEEVVEETVEPAVEEVVEETVEPAVEEVVEEPVVEEVVEQPAEEVVEETVEEQPVEEVVEEPVVEEVVEQPAEEPAQEEASEDGDNEKSGKFAVIDTSVIIPKKSHEEKYADLDEDSKKYYDAIMAYAEGLADVKRQSSVNADTIFYGRTCVVKTQIKQTKVVCSFSMLDAEMKRMLKSNKGAQEKFTSIRIVDDESLEAAKKSVDFAYKAAIAEKEYKHQMQLQKRRDARKAKKEAAATDAE